MVRRLVTLVFLAAVAAPAAAQDRPRRERDRDFEDRLRTFSFSFGPDGWRMDFRRGRLGVFVDLTPDPARDSVGARVAGVTPGGPADRAGVRTGDLVVRLNGTRLAATGGQARRREDDDDSGEADGSRPGLRLIELASRLDAGDTVRLELRRDGRTIQVTLIAAESDLDRMAERVRGTSERLRQSAERLQVLAPQRMRDVQVYAFGSSALADLELVRMNPGLADYFGTSEGLLVVDAPDTSSLGLRAGDVILSIGGRRPASPAQALRVLSTYQPDEAVQFEVMRQRRRTTVSGRMPERREWRVEPNLFEMELEPPRMLRIEAGT